jgi:hypothetical protein
VKRLLVIFLFLVILAGGGYWGSVYYYHHWFDTHLMGTVWTPSKEQELAEIINQPYRYLGKGSSSKAYVSADNRFVIKTFIKNRFASKRCKYLPIIRDLENKRKALKVKYERSFGPIYAYQYIPRESGMIFYQFVRPRNLFHQTIRLTEQDGSISELDLDKDEYVIQKKAVIVSQYLKNHLDQGDLNAVKSGITKLLRLTKTLYDQGIVLVVLQFLDNFGFVGDEPIRIDVEHLCFDPDWKEKEGKGHLRRQLADFRAWIANNAPAEILDYFDNESRNVYFE